MDFRVVCVGLTFPKNSLFCLERSSIFEAFSFFRHGNTTVLEWV